VRAPPRVGEAGQRPGIAGRGPLPDVGVVEPLAAQDRGLRAVRGRFVLRDDQRLVPRGERPPARTRSRIRDADLLVVDLTRFLGRRAAADHVIGLQSCPTSQTPKPGVSHRRLTERGPSSMAIGWSEAGVREDSRRGSGRNRHPLELTRPAAERPDPRPRTSQQSEMACEPVPGRPLLNPTRPGSTAFPRSGPLAQAPQEGSPRRLGRPRSHHRCESYRNREFFQRHIRHIRTHGHNAVPSSSSPERGSICVVLRAAPVHEV